MLIQLLHLTTERGGKQILKRKKKKFEFNISKPYFPLNWEFPILSIVTGVCSRLAEFFQFFHKTKKTDLSTKDFPSFSDISIWL